jgi:hypothetical protein
MTCWRCLQKTLPRCDEHSSPKWRLILLPHLSHLNRLAVVCAQDANKAGFSISDCVNVVVTGPVTAYNALWSIPFTQGTITSITNDSAHGYSWTVQVGHLTLRLSQLESHSFTEYSGRCGVLDCTLVLYMARVTMIFQRSCADSRDGFPSDAILWQCVPNAVP